MKSLLTVGIVMAILLCIIYVNCSNCRQNKPDYTEIDEELIKDYLVNDDNEEKLPIMWIHMPFEYNARHWASFGSRSSTNINQPYFALTLQSIIKNCDDSFKICLIDDASFARLIPNWKIKLNKLSDPVLQYIRQLGMAQLLHLYGGMVVPASFLCFKDLLPLYEKGLSTNEVFVGQNINRSAIASAFAPNTEFMGAIRNSEVMKRYIEFLQRNVSTDYTAQLGFTGKFVQWINAEINANKITLTQGSYLGTKTTDNQPILVDNLLTQTPISLDDDAYGIWIPAKEILSRRHYEWFARMDAQQIFESNCTLCNYFVLALAPDSKKNGVLTHPDWVSFWKTPRAAVWGLKPTHLGNNIAPEEYPYYGS